MTRTRDFDRLARAWLELMPDEAPDRVIADVLQAVDSTPQMRRPIGAPFRRSFQMNRFSFIAAAAALVIVGLVGLSLAGGTPGPTVGASTPASPPPSQGPGTSPSPQIVAGATAIADNGLLASGSTYTVAAFTPAFTFKGQDGWLVWATDSDEVQVLVDSVGNKENGQFTVMRVGQVLEPGGAVGGAAAPLPADIIAWFQARPDLILEAPSAIKVSGIDGTLLRGSVRPEAINPMAGRLEVACEAGVPACTADNLRSALTLWAGGFEVIALKVQGQQILIAFSAQAASWDTIRPQLEAFLAGITFVSPPG
jgi:hypothetical protein